MARTSRSPTTAPPTGGRRTDAWSLSSRRVRDFGIPTVMMIRGFVATAATALCLLAGSAHADPKSEIAAKSKQAMESYDLMDYEAAKKLLNQALATSKK